MDKDLIVDLVTAGLSFAGAFVGGGFALRSVKKQNQQAMRALSASHRAELIRRQLNALETIWSIFEATSRTGGENRIIQWAGDDCFVSVFNAKQFIEKLEATFNSKSGLYLSEKCRRQLFLFRDDIKRIITQLEHQDGLIPFRSYCLTAFYKKRKRLRLVIRDEIGSRNLKVAQEELIRLSES